MHSRALMILLSGAIGLLATGCASSTPTLRGQNPDGGFGAWGGAAGMGHGDCQSGMCQPGHSGHAPQCGPGGSCQHGHGGMCRGGAGCNLPFHPVHRNFHTYDAPRGLMYPPENAAPAQVQYPYYTLRGPTDFFME
jgi:hypothetical protein